MIKMLHREFMIFKIVYTKNIALIRHGLYDPNDGRIVCIRILEILTVFEDLKVRKHRLHLEQSVFGYRMFPSAS